MRRLTVQLNASEPLEVGLAGRVIASGNDYETLKNKPSINQVVLVGNNTSKDLHIIGGNTTAAWDAMPEYVPIEGEIVFYSDHTIREDEHGNEIWIPGIKIGDGETTVGDLPFVDESVLDRLMEHVNDSSVHVSPDGKRLIPAGGLPGDILIKRSGGDYEAEWVTPATSAEQDNTRPITAAAVYTEIGNINALLATI